MALISGVRKSVYDTLRGAFVDGTMMGVPYSVYDEGDLRDGVQPQRPFVCILDYGSSFELRYLPAIVVQMSIRKRPLALGETAYFCYVLLHVFGRNRSERDAIASAIMENVEAIDVRDYTEEQEPIVESVPLQASNNDGDIWVEEVIELPPRLVLEGTAANWTSLIGSFWVTRAEV